VVSVGTNVAVIVEDPAPAIVTVELEMVATDVNADVYDHVPATFADGEARLKAASPYFLFGDGKLRAPSVGVARVIVIDTGSLVSAL
jgi:hypothetical protein